MQITDAVSRGSELHVFQTARMLEHAMQHGQPEEGAADADAAASQQRNRKAEAAAMAHSAHLSRYGRAGDEEVGASMGAPGGGSSGEGEGRARVNARRQLLVRLVKLNAKFGSNFL